MFFYVVTIVGGLLAVILSAIEYWEQKNKQKRYSFKLLVAIFAVIATLSVAVLEHYDSDQKEISLNLKLKTIRDQSKENLVKAEASRELIQSQFNDTKDQLGKAEGSRKSIQEKLGMTEIQLTESQATATKIQSMLTKSSQALVTTKGELAAFVKAKNASDEAKKKRLDQIFEKWKQEPAKKDLGDRKLGGLASGRRIGAWYEIQRKRLGDGKTQVTITFQGRCSSNNYAFGSQGTFRLRIAGQEVRSVSVSCGSESKRSSAPGTYTLTNDQVEYFKPSDVALSRDYE